MNDASAAAAWSAWANVMPVAVASQAGGLARVVLPVQVPPGADGMYADLRLIDNRGTETPYALDPTQATEARETTPVQTKFVPGRGSEALFDLRPGAAVGCVDIFVDAEERPSYFEHVAIDLGRDPRHLRTVRTDAIIYRVADDDGRGDQRVNVPETHARWLRVRVLDPRGPFAIASASTSASPSRTGASQPLEPLPIVPNPVASGAEHRQVWIFSAPRPFRPSAVTFEDADGTFVRPTRIEMSPDGRAWSFAGDGTIARYADGTVQTSFGFPEDTAATWRVVVENGDDAPLTSARPVLLAVPHALVFPAAPGRSYRLLFGNPAAAPPSYDLRTRLAHARWRAGEATLGPVLPNAAFRDPRRWQRIAWFVAGIVGAAALVAAAASLAVRGLRPKLT